MRCNFSAVAARVSTAACACDAAQVRLYPDVSHTLTAMYPVPDWHFAWAFTHGRQVCDVRNETCACMCDLLSSDSEPFTRPHGRHHSNKLQQLFPDGRQCWLRFMYESLNFTVTGLGVTCTRALITCRRIHHPSHHVAQTAKVPVTTGTKQCGQVCRAPLSPFPVPCCVAHPIAALYLEPSLSPFQVVAIISTCCPLPQLPLQAMQQFAGFHFGAAAAAPAVRLMYGLEQNWIGDAVSNAQGAPVNEL